MRAGNSASICRMSMVPTPRPCCSRVNDEAPDLTHAICLAGAHRTDQPPGLGRFQGHRSCEFFAQIFQRLGERRQRPVVVQARLGLIGELLQLEDRWRIVK